MLKGDGIMQKLKDFRISKGLSQEKLARKMDITLSYYSQVERGKVPPARIFMEKLKQCFPEILIGKMFFNE